ncbi:cupin domain-containing protein [Bradyrhizobium elkanii]|uniref:Quercetin dioxygenase-like cupin family protein n=1 Tax=Bradyrhizobium elkanii TaxID=29448 RepID=A0A8I1YD80_BRAEL|nr:cupin domain-containing protein [Bradyrhizobium elkanii]MBP1296414.1 quercetin dioxygenase-like cupin family protein [Bradyrhizobium elkanii]
MSARPPANGISKSIPQPIVDIRLASLEASEKVVFGPLSFYQPLIDRGETPVFMGIQTCEPGYFQPMHWHPYTECLVVLEGEANAWLIGKETEKKRGKAGDVFEFPPNVPHAFEVAGQATVRVLGVHCSPVRIVHFVDSSLVMKNGYQVLDEQLAPTY